MKITIEFNKTRLAILSVVLVFLLVVSITVEAQRTTSRKAATGPEQQPSIAEQFGGSFACMITQCGWPALIFMVLPALAVYVWKKFFSWG